jgi:hypothetical protein
VNWHDFFRRNVHDVEDDFEWVTYDDGTSAFRRDANPVVSEEFVRAMWDGRLCSNCYEPLEPAWPTRCPLCAFPVKAEQHHRLEQRTREEAYKPRPREFEDTKTRAAKSGILVPRSP